MNIHFFSWVLLLFKVVGCIFEVQLKYYIYWGCNTWNWPQLLLKKFLPLCLMFCDKWFLVCVCILLETPSQTAIGCCFNSILHRCSPLCNWPRWAQLCCSFESWCVFPRCRWTSWTSTTSYRAAQQRALCLQEIVKIKQKKKNVAELSSKFSRWWMCWSYRGFGPCHSWNSGRPGLRRDHCTSKCTFHPAGWECLRCDMACTYIHCTLPRSLMSPVSG